MGRKIPGKKHRGVKDPAKQQFVRNEKLKMLINAPPSDPSMQELPKSVLEINRLRELVKAGNFQKKRRKRKNKLIDSGIFSGAGPQLPGMEQRDLRFPRVKQKPGESDAAFLHRLDLSTNDILNEAKLESKHDVHVNRNESGTITDVKPKPKNSLDDSERTIHKKFKNKKKVAQAVIGSSKDKLSYLKEKKLKKKLKKININEDELETKKDIIKFGEVVHHPPQLKKRPRGCDVSSSDRPGKKKLILSDLLNPGNCGQSMAHKKQIASAREEAIKVYKDMKARNKQLLKT